MLANAMQDIYSIYFSYTHYAVVIAFAVLSAGLLLCQTECKEHFSD